MYVVTGGAGFIGSNIAAALADREIGPVAICDRLRSGEKWRNIAKRQLADIINPEELLPALDSIGSQVSGVVHMGAISSTTETDADLTVAVNFRLSVALWRWCTERQVPFIYASSAATYGSGEAGFDDVSTPSELARFQPLNLYGWSKHLFDRWAADHVSNGRAAPPQWAGLKFFNVYGPNEYHKGAQASVVSHVFPNARSGKPARLFRSYRPGVADGGQLRDFVWVGDCADVVVWLLENRHVSGLFNVGSGRARSFADLASAVFHALERPPMIEYVPMPEAIRGRYQYFTQASLQRLRAAGYTRPFTELEQGVKTYVQDYLAAADPYR